MNELTAIVALGTASTVLRFAAAAFLILVAIGLVYALVRLGRTLAQAEIMLTDVNTEIVPLLKEATQTLDNINEELVKVDAVMTTVVDVTDKVDSTTRAVESAVSLPAKKAAAWGAGVSQAVSSLFGRGAAGDDEQWAADGTADWYRETPGSAAREAAPFAAAADAGPASGMTSDAGQAFSAPSDTGAQAGGASAAAPDPAGEPATPVEGSPS